MQKYDFSDLKDKVVLLVGGLGFIGRSISSGFANLGSNLIIADIDKNKKFLELLNKTNPLKIHYIKFDITKDKEVEILINKVVKQFGKVDVMVNCSWPRTKDWATKLEKVPYRSVKKNLIYQLGGYYNVAQKTALQMAKQKFGSIINFSSIYGKVAPTFSVYEETEMTSPVAYGLIKGGINMMTKYFASYFGKNNVRVNCISPGGVQNQEDKKFVSKYNKLTPLGRMAKTEDLVMPVLFLASDASKYITGHNLMVDGGWSIH